MIHRKINLRKKIYDSQDANFVLLRLKEAAEMGFLEERMENNPHLMVSYRGVESAGISPKWNVKIYNYNSKKHGHSLVCVDTEVLQRILDGDLAGFTPPADLKVLKIDDAGWGFPLGGVMVGISDEETVAVAVVPVDYFRADTPHSFDTGEYLNVYSQMGMELLEKFDATPDTHRIEICTGYVNQVLREDLRKRGYDVRVVEIKGLLQDQLEDSFRAYVEEVVGADIYYDPKDMKKSDIPRRYSQALEYGKLHCPYLIKTGWQSMGQ